MKALSAFDATDRLLKLTGLPTLVLSGEHDIIFPPFFGRELAAGIPGAKFVEVPAQPTV